MSDKPSPESGPKKADDKPSPKPEREEAKSVRTTPEEDERALQRVARLVVLAAGNPSENEGTVAAKTAVKLIHKHRLRIITTTTMEIYREVIERLRVSSPGHRAAPDELAGLEHPYPMTAKFDGVCTQCREGYRRGDRIWYRAGVGAVHAMRCDPGSLM